MMPLSNDMLESLIDDLQKELTNLGEFSDVIHLWQEPSRDSIAA